MPELEEDYIKTGKVKYVIRDFPPRVHPSVRIQGGRGSQVCRRSEEALGDARRIFANQRAMSPADLVGHAKACYGGRLTRKMWKMS